MAILGDAEHFVFFISAVRAVTNTKAYHVDPTKPIGNRQRSRSCIEKKLVHCWGAKPTSTAEERTYPAQNL